MLTKLEKSQNFPNHKTVKKNTGPDGETKKDADDKPEREGRTKHKPRSHP